MSNYINRWTILLFSVLSFLLLAFGRNILQSAGDFMVELNSSSPVVSLSDNEFAQVRGYHFDPLVNNAHGISVSDLKVESVVAGKARIGFNLLSPERGNEFPSLRIFITGANGNVERFVDFGEHQYQHDARLDTDRIFVEIEILRGDVGFTVKPRYLEDQK